MADRAVSIGELQAVVDRSLDWLVEAQLPTGELPSYAKQLNDPTATWSADQLNFITALGAEALDGVDDPRAVSIVDRAVAFLRREREPSALWRYWARSNERVEFTPPDADDTACCSIAVGCRGDDTRANLKVLRATAAPDGRYHTWLIPHARIADPRSWWVLRAERRGDTRALRQELWTNTEADPDDIDAVVNANVCRYLGPDRASDGAIRWVASVVLGPGTGTADKWHRSPYTLWAAVADGAARGIDAFSDLTPVLLDRVASSPAARGEASDVDTALALHTVQRCGGSAALRSTLARRLVERQDPGGAWARDVVFFGGPTEVFGWAAESLSTARAVAALAAECSERSG